MYKPLTYTTQTNKYTMKYFNIYSINKAISSIRKGKNTNKHITSRAVLGILNFYFRVENDFIITPEQIQSVSRMRPNYTIEKVANIFIPHCFVEVKSLVKSNIGNILDKLYSTIMITMDNYGNISGNFSVFMIAVKGTKITFYTYHNFHSLLDDHGTAHYKGFIPLNYIIRLPEFTTINSEQNIADYDYYVRSMKFHTEPETLVILGAIGTDQLPHHHALDLYVESSREEIAILFSRIARKSANIFI